MGIQITSNFQGENTNGTLFLVPTPIGNLGDMSPRAVKTLQEVDLIAAEDTRNTQKLLNHFEINTKQISFHEYNTKERLPQLVAKLQQGLDIAQVSDAGMPSISDPGAELVQACVGREIRVVPIPGPNAALTALIASGLCPQPFLFYGFLSRKNTERKEQLQGLTQQTISLIFYEAPHRLLKTLKSLGEAFGTTRQIVLCRELTKRYEEFLRGTIADAIEWANNSEIKGEFVLIVEGNQAPLQEEPKAVLPLEEQVDLLIKSENLKTNDAIKRIAKQNKLKKQVVYNEYHHLK
ncbi:16S rRNA (cytidine(1402)-2'-O)-methyltransferase [Ligilactobacillus acidipiscis]|uniref:16S rRNA (cytidine(1402)-2'-O)-methyltransferase n=1 Tax=Ligilactobacillus acidipiscis TaxID=89059 RepID=UPI0023F71F21|nr:16S rRNA (cytidine(1402)-2'-O)-methyltransferase [Ligilactobacillus acidipiscis]WEV57752.1 16S rRNA (cytidine(1402)-2'-O)-methyltransferase [Ligilactobacillus acidipiscis]